LAIGPLIGAISAPFTSYAVRIGIGIGIGIGYWYWVLGIAIAKLLP
jgi:hypothetical protein